MSILHPDTDTPFLLQRVTPRAVRCHPLTNNTPSRRFRQKICENACITWAGAELNKYAGKRPARRITSLFKKTQPRRKTVSDEPISKRFARTEPSAVCRLHPVPCDHLRHRRRSSAGVSGRSGGRVGAQRDCLEFCALRSTPLRQTQDEAQAVPYQQHASIVECSHARWRPSTVRICGDAG